MAAYDKAPPTSIPSYSSNGTNITIPIASLSVTDGDVRQTLSSADAHTTTGDVAEVLLAILNRVFKTYDANDKPTKWSMSRSSSASGTTGNISFGISFQTTIPTPPTQTVQNET